MHHVQTKHKLLPIHKLHIHTFTMHNTNLRDIVLGITTTDSKIKFGDREGKQIEIKKFKIDSSVTMDLNTDNTKSSRMSSIMFY